VKRAASILFCLALIFTVVSTASAYPGRTDKNGGHNCSQASKDKGLCDGYHYHNGTGDTGSGESKSNSGTKVETDVGTDDVLRLLSR